MKVAIIGSGGREHSICYKLKQSKNLKKLVCIPGNAGTAQICENLNVDISNFNQLYDELKKNEIDIVIVGPEVPLVEGIKDFLEQKSIKVFGPSKKASQLEGSKLFLKNFCSEFKIPSARFQEVKNLSEVSDCIDKFGLPIVVKSDGLAAGKGVTICNKKEEALNDIKAIFSGKFKSSKKVILEEFLKGEEASYFVITDGEDFLPIGTAQDHKRIFENDVGPNTGGMGAYSPSYLITDDIESKIINRIIKPTLVGMKKIGSPFSGILYAGLMINNGDPKLIEYNIRFGDPECQILMMRMKSDFLKIVINTIEKNLKNKKIEWYDYPGITIVASNKGYPGDYDKSTVIKNLNKIDQNENIQIFHAGTSNVNGEIIAIGGRVLNSTVTNKSLKIARDEALRALDKLEWKNKYYRRDIGWRVIK
ncbi:MAG: phosphoribosylamine--glycine ligase [Candidatus Pelagibacter sp.]|nr:phosphoribosylamine--glycine ligase [Candidatus Pelagibacter sp.]|tara:strand:- start:32321 stop:33583 length:1263 start_codon:yes stop_codon:yes gene_type:complete